MVQKAETGSWRPCGDFRNLNAKTVADRYPILLLHDFAIGSQGTRTFTKMDLVKAYYQIPVVEEDRKKRQLQLLLDFLSSQECQLRLHNAAQTFQRLIDEVLRGLPFAFAYIDNVLIASRDIKEHQGQMYDRILYNHGKYHIVQILLMRR